MSQEHGASTLESRHRQPAADAKVRVDGTGKPFRVLVLPGGTEIGLEIRAALHQCKEVVLHSAGADVSSHAPFVFARHFVVRDVRQPGFLDELNELLVRERIDYIFPAHDEVLAILAQNAGRLRARVVSSPPETCLLTRSKAQTYRHLAGAVPVPEVYDGPADVRSFPVFLKPDRGQGSQGVDCARDRDELALLAGRGLAGKLLLEYLPGEEYTVDCFSDREAGLLFCSGRRRTRTRSGIAMHSCAAADDLFADYARRIAGRLPLWGAWFFQLKRDRQGTLKLLEVGPRVAGTMALHRVQGVNFPLLSLYEQERVPVQILCNDHEVEIDRALVNRYRHNLVYRTVYVDLDDTLIFRGQVNTRLVQFLYQCVNQGVRLVLLSRHAGVIDDTLKRHRLHGLFDEIVVVPPGQPKGLFIEDREALFIDDSFRERRSVWESKGVPTFDSSMIEMLLEERS